MPKTTAFFSGGGLWATQTAKLLAQYNAFLRAAQEGTGEQLNKQTLETVLRLERNAWAFVFKKISPFLDKKTLENLHTYVHQYALQNYSQAIRMVQEKGKT